MSFAIPRGALEEAFGAGNLVTIPQERLNAAVRHAGARRFLTEVGLPVVEDFVYDPGEHLGSGLPAAGSVEPELDDFDNLPDTVGDWVAMGYCFEDTLVLDGDTGIVWVLPDGELEARTVNSGIDLFVSFLTALHRDFDRFDEGVALATRQAAADALTAQLRAADPSAFGGPESYWSGVLDQLVHDYPAF